MLGTPAFDLLRARGQKRRQAFVGEPPYEIMGFKEGDEKILYAPLDWVGFHFYTRRIVADASDTGAFGGGFSGVLLAAATLFALKNFGPAGIPHLQETTLDLRVIACSMAATFFTGILFGFAPALGATSLNLIEALKEGGQRARGSASAPRIRNVLVVAEVAMALVLVISAGLLVRTFYSMLHANAGFSVTRVVTFELPLPSAKYADTTRMAKLYQEVLLRLRAIPTVERAGLASAVPMGGALDGTGIRIPEHPVADASESPFVNYSFISPGYFATIGTPLLHGRDIGNADTLDSGSSRSCVPGHRLRPQTSRPVAAP